MWVDLERSTICLVGFCEIALLGERNAQQIQRLQIARLCFQERPQQSNRLVILALTNEGLRSTVVLAILCEQTRREQRQKQQDCPQVAAGAHVCEKKCLELNCAMLALHNFDHAQSCKKLGLSPARERPSGGSCMRELGPQN